MSIARADFLRLLPQAVALPRLSETVFGEEGRVLAVNLAEAEPLVIASLRLPVLEVELVFEGFTDHAREEALALFDRMYQRGGG